MKVIGLSKYEAVSVWIAPMPAELDFQMLLVTTRSASGA